MGAATTCYSLASSESFDSKTEDLVAGGASRHALQRTTQSVFGILRFKDGRPGGRWSQQACPPENYTKRLRNPSIQRRKTWWPVEPAGMPSRELHKASSESFDSKTEDLVAGGASRHALYRIMEDRRDCMEK